MRKDLPRDMFLHLLSELRTGEYIVGCEETVMDTGNNTKFNKYRAVSLRDGVELLNIQRARIWGAGAGFSKTFDETYKFTCNVLGQPICRDSYTFRATVDDVDDRAAAFLQPNFAFMYAELKKREDIDFNYKLAESLLKMRRAQLGHVRASMHDDFNR